MANPRQCTLLFVALVAVLLTGCGTPSHTGSSLTPAGDKLLTELRQQLDLVREKKQVADTEAFEARMDFDLAPLVGLYKSDIVKALGEPFPCARRPNVAPCSGEADWFYSFYYLPPSMVGGGPELLLSFDNAGNCTAARWVVTR